LWCLSLYGRLHSLVFKSSRRPQSRLGQPKACCETCFHYFQFVSKYDRLRHAIIIRSTAIWLVISNPRLASPHVTRNVAQTLFTPARGSGHKTTQVQDWNGLGTRLGTVSGLRGQDSGWKLIGSQTLHVHLQLERLDREKGGGLWRIPKNSIK